MRSLATSLVRSQNTRPASIQFLHLLANAITRLCFNEFELRQRIAELEAVFNVTMTLAEARDLTSVLNRAVKLVAELMDVKAVSIRLIDRENDELKIAAVHNLSSAYLAKGKIRFSQAAIDQEALSPKGFDYSADLGADPRTLFPEDAKREGIASMLSVGMRYQGKPVGVLRIYTETVRQFTTLQINLLKAVAAQAGAAIENARLLAEHARSGAIGKAGAHGGGSAAADDSAAAAENSGDGSGERVRAVFRIGWRLFRFLSIAVRQPRIGDRGRQRQGSAGEFDHGQRAGGAAGTGR